MTVKVIRIIQYEGTEAAVRDAIQKSMPLGTKDCIGYSLTIAEHSNDLPPILTLDPESVVETLNKAESVYQTAQMDGPFIDALIENRAIEIYDSWNEMDGWVPWLIGGNSTKQSEARREARKELKL